MPPADPIPTDGAPSVVEDTIKAETIARAIGKFRDVTDEVLLAIVADRKLGTVAPIDASEVSLSALVAAIREYGVPRELLPVLADELTRTQSRILFEQMERTAPKRPDSPLDGPAPAASSASSSGPSHDGRIGEDEIRWLADHLTEEHLAAVIKLRGNEREMAYWRASGVKASTHYVVLTYVNCVVNGTRAELKPFDENGQPVAVPVEWFDAKTAANMIAKGQIGIPGRDRSKLSPPSANIGRPVDTSAPILA